MLYHNIYLRSHSHSFQASSLLSRSFSQFHKQLTTEASFGGAGGPSPSSPKEKEKRKEKKKKKRKKERKKKKKRERKERKKRKKKEGNYVRIASNYYI